MKLPTLQPRDRQSERRHYDPPALWYAVILGSVVFHLSAFGMLRLLMVGGLIGTPSATKLIPIDIIAMATPTAGIASSKPNTKLPQKTTVKPTKKPTASKPTTTSSPTRTNTQTGATKQPAVNTKKSPAPISSKPSEKLQPKTKPTTPTGKNNQPTTNTNNQPATTTPTSPSPTKPTSNTTPNPQPAGGFVATFNNLTPSATIDIPNPDKDNDKLATLLDEKKQLSAEDLKQLGISLNQNLKLKVGVVVETDGTATVVDKQVVVEQGSISQEKAVALANKIISQLRFTPTFGNGKPKLANYNLQLKIFPEPK
ncbi:MAG: hypothetical protein WBG73_18970 [Coleofasciculaceae cyanobacterium]